VFSPGQGRTMLLDKLKCYKVVNCNHGNLTAYNLPVLLGSDSCFEVTNYGKNME